jgi:hypothetical protein
MVSSGRSDYNKGRRRVEVTVAGRREFLTLGAGAAAGLLLPRAARATDSRIEVLLGEPIGTIAPEVYGHFVEHLGGVVYDGCPPRWRAGRAAASRTATTGATA